MSVAAGDSFNWVLLLCDSKRSVFDYTSIISDTVRDEVLARLREIEREEDVIIFYACESGSRAWGFPSANSDYDVRFLYAHPAEWYLSVDLEYRRDVIERPISDMLDISGWDLRKALGLLRKSNPPLLEWLQSPLIYREHGTVADKMRAMIAEYHSPRSTMYHYLHMAQKNFKEYLKRDIVRTKKYFYVLRPLLAVKWIEADFGPVPMEFETLVNRLVESSDLRDEIDRLLAAKRRGDELDSGPRIEPIHRFIESELGRLENPVSVPKGPELPLDILNSFFREALGILAKR